MVQTIPVNNVLKYLHKVLFTPPPPDPAVIRSVLIVPCCLCLVWTLFLRYAPTEITRSSQVDQVLCGFLDIIRTLIHLSPPLKGSPLISHDTTGVMTHIFGACLFDRPSFADRFVSRVPKCRTPASRLV
jgi:hypothetical protein